MDWARILAYVTGTVDQELPARKRVSGHRKPLKGRVMLSDAERATLGEIGHRLDREVVAEVATVRYDRIAGAMANLGGSPCDRGHNVAQQPIAIAGSNGLPVFRTPKHSAYSLRIAATTVCLGLRRPWAFNRVTSATIAGLHRMADM